MAAVDAGLLATRRLGRPLPRRRRAQRRQRVDGDDRRRDANDSNRPRAGLRLRPRRWSSSAARLGALVTDVNGLPILSVMTWAPFVAALAVMFFARRSPLLVRLLSLAGRHPSRCWRRSGSTSRTTGRRPASSSRRASRWCRSLGISYLLGHRRDERVDVPAHVDHHLRGRLRVVDGEGTQPGVLRPAAHPGHRRVRRLRLARPVRLLPLLRDRRVADVSAHRHLGLVWRGETAGDLRLGIRSNRRRDQRVRRDEADPVSALRVGLHPGGHPALFTSAPVRGRSRS